MSELIDKIYPYIIPTIILVGFIWGIAKGIFTAIYNFFAGLATLKETVEDIRDNHLAHIQKDINCVKEEVDIIEGKIEKNSKEIHSINGYLEGRNGKKSE